jgi:hypothetical protein
LSPANVRAGDQKSSKTAKASLADTDVTSAALFPFGRSAREPAVGRCAHRDGVRGALILLAAWAVFSLTQNPARAQTASMTSQSNIQPPEIRVSGRTVYRWQIDDAQASLLENDCVLRRDGRQFRANRVLIVSDGPRGKVRNRIVFEGLRTAEGKQNPTPRSVVWISERDPSIDAPQFRGRPDSRPFLMEFLPDDSIEAIGIEKRGQDRGNEIDRTVRPAQFTEPIPDPNANAGAMTGPAETIPTPASPTPASPTPASPTPVPLGSPNGETIRLQPPPTRGLPLAEDPPPPTVFDDGATTRGPRFFFGGGTKSIEIDSRGASTPPVITNTPRPETNESVITARGGVTIRVRDVAATLPDGQFMQFGTVTLSADRIVAWLPMMTNLFGAGADLSSAEGEIYLEGDIVFRQGENVIYADSMYYNVTRETGLVLDAEAITAVPEYQGIVRLKAEVLQQVSRGNFRAFDAAVTSSRMGVPRYWLQSERLEFEERTRNVIDARSGRMVADRDHHVTSSNNFVFLGGIPVFYWPRFATSLRRPTFYVTGAKVSNDAAFGTQFLLDWDVFQLFGVDRPPDGVDWELSTDYLSERGPAIGTRVDYDIPGFLSVPGRTRGFIDAWGISDSGKDRLGLDRLALEPETDVRGRALMRHRQWLANDYELIAEVGYLSDRNFLEQYLEREWDRELDHSTGLRLRKYHFNQLFDLSADVQVNDFYQETEQLPSVDHYLLGGTFLGQVVTWSMHNHASYTRLNAAEAPIDPAEAAEYSPLPGEQDADGVIASTRQELAVTLPVGPFNLRPKASVEAAHYGEAADGDSLTRLLGQAGVALNLPMMRVDPTIQSSLFNVKGLAHKLDWTAEYWYADSDTNLDELPLYDPLDDNPQEQFRRRFIGDTFGGTLPDRFDPRNYAFRHGLQEHLSSPSDVIADDLQHFRFGLNQRFQTKRGLPGRERVVDLVQFDVGTILFPKADRDNFGETIGPTTYDFRYHIGDRYSIVSDGYIDFFDDGLRSVSAGIRTSRPGRSDTYIGLLSIEGPISSTVVRTTTDYRLNEKWIFSGGTTYDFGETGNIGQSFGLTRIGESLLLRVDFNVDSGRDNVGLSFMLEPRFAPRTLGVLGGGMIPPPGAEGLE